MRLDASGTADRAFERNATFCITEPVSISWTPEYTAQY